MLLAPLANEKGSPLSSPSLQEEVTRALGGHEVAGEVGVRPRDEHHLVDVSRGEGSLQSEVLRLSEVELDAMKPPIGVTSQLRFLDDKRATTVNR